MLMMLILKPQMDSSIHSMPLHNCGHHQHPSILISGRFFGLIFVYVFAYHVCVCVCVHVLSPFMVTMSVSIESSFVPYRFPSLPFPFLISLTPFIFARTLYPN